MKKSVILVYATIMVLSVAALSAYAVAGARATWVLRGSEGIIIGGYSDNFDYGGGNTRAIEGDIKLQVNAENDVGSVVTKVIAPPSDPINPEAGVYLTGEVKIVMNHFSGPMPFMEGGIADDIFVHGATGQGPPVMPKVKTFLGGWGTADVYVSDLLTYTGLDAHFMYSDGARDSDLKVWLDAAKTTLWSPMHGMMGSDGYTDPNDRELHIVAHSTTPDPGNFPPHTVWFHLNFEEVEVKVSPPEAVLSITPLALAPLLMLRREQ